jgi:hypothetical protein
MAKNCTTCGPSQLTSASCQSPGSSPGVALRQTPYPQGLLATPLATYLRTVTAALKAIPSSRSFTRIPVCCCLRALIRFSQPSADLPPGARQTGAPAGTLCTGGSANPAPAAPYAAPADAGQWLDAGRPHSVSSDSSNSSTLVTSIPSVAVCYPQAHSYRGMIRVGPFLSIKSPSSGAKSN